MYKSIASADGWFFIHPNAEEDKPPVVYALAMWALPETGEPIGLVAINRKNAPPQITSVPPVAGRYVYRDDMTQEQLDQLLGYLRTWAS